MQEINVKLIKQKIRSSNIFISPKLSKTFELSMECKVKMKTSKNENEKNVLLNIEMNIRSKEEELKIELLSDTFFELDRLPETYEALAEQTLVPIAREKLLNSLDEMLVVMGYKKMELAKNIANG